MEEYRKKAVEFVKCGDVLLTTFVDVEQNPIAVFAYADHVQLSARKKFCMEVLGFGQDDIRSFLSLSKAEIEVIRKAARLKSLRREIEDLEKEMLKDAE